jgi:hypothetical protein
LDHHVSAPQELGYRTYLALPRRPIRFLGRNPVIRLASASINAGKALQAKILASPSPVVVIAVKNRTLASVAERFIE